MIKHLLFDADGVLFLHTDKMFSERIVAEYGAPVEKLTDFFENVWPDCIVNKRDMKQELAKHMRGWNWSGTVEELMDYWYSYEHDTDQPLISYIRHLRKQGIHASVATNNDHYRAEWLFKHLNLDVQVFDTLYAAGDVGVTKPDGAFFTYVMNDLVDMAPAEVLLWDDSPKNVTGARDFGLQAERYTTYQEFETIMKRYV